MTDRSRRGGQLRGRALDGRGDFVLRGDDVSGELALALGSSRLDARGRIGDTLEVDARFAPLHLDDLWPDAAGSLRGSLKLTGARNAPNIDADLDGSGLRWGDYRADALQARGRLPWRGWRLTLHWCMPRRSVSTPAASPCTWMWRARCRPCGMPATTGRSHSSTRETRATRGRTPLAPVRWWSRSSSSELR